MQEPGDADGTTRQRRIAELIREQAPRKRSRRKPRALPPIVIHGDHNIVAGGDVIVLHVAADTQ